MAYDPVKAHEYYMKYRKKGLLKGRKKGRKKTSGKKRKQETLVGLSTGGLNDAGKMEWAMRKKQLSAEMNSALARAKTPEERARIQRDYQNMALKELRDIKSNSDYATPKKAKAAKAAKTSKQPKEKQEKQKKQEKKSATTNKSGSGASSASGKTQTQSKTKTSKSNSKPNVVHEKINSEQMNKKVKQLQKQTDQLQQKISKMTDEQKKKAKEKIQETVDEIEKLLDEYRKKGFKWTLEDWMPTAN